MELLVLKAYASGYRGCALDDRQYFFFQYSRKKGLKILQRYLRSDFEDLEHFIGVMAKFLSLSAFILPPLPISGLTENEMDRVYNRIGKR